MKSRILHVLGTVGGAIGVILPVLDMLPPDARAMRIGSTSVGAVLLLLSNLARILKAAEKPAEAPPPKG